MKIRTCLTLLLLAGVGLLARICCGLSGGSPRTQRQQSSLSATEKGDHYAAQ